MVIMNNKIIISDNGKKVVWISIIIHLPPPQQFWEAWLCLPYYFFVYQRVNTQSKENIKINRYILLKKREETQPTQM